MAQTKKEKKRVNAFDVVVILLTVCLLLTFAYRIYAGLADESYRSEIKYVMAFECDAEYDSILNYLSEGDAVYLASDGTLLGYLYVGEDDENGAVYQIVDDIPTFAGAGELYGNGANAENSDPEAESGSEAESSAETETTPAQPQAYVPYDTVKLGGQIRLNIETMRVKSGNYYTIGKISFTEGSTVEVYTDSAVFTLKVTNITLAEE